MYLGLSQVTYAYDDGPTVLDNFSLSIEAGESVALMGANGCGKTTVLQLLSGLVKPTQGSLYFRGAPVDEGHRNDKTWMKGYHQQVGYVFQRSVEQLFCPAVREEIGFGPLQMGLSDVGERVRDMAKLFQIEPLLDAVPYHLSGGQQKRVALAATLAVNPSVLLLDEPMAALDPRTQELLLRILNEWHAMGKTLVVATHDIRMVSHMVDRIVLFGEDHRIVLDGPVRDVLARTDVLQQVNVIGDHYHVHYHDEHWHGHEN